MYKREEEKKCNLRLKFPCLRLAHLHCISAIGCINKSTIEENPFFKNIYYIFLCVMSVLPLSQIVFFFSNL